MSNDCQVRRSSASTPKPTQQDRVALSEIIIQNIGQNAVISQTFLQASTYLLVNTKSGVLKMLNNYNTNIIIVKKVGLWVKVPRSVEYSIAFRKLAVANAMSAWALCSPWVCDPGPPAASTCPRVVHQKQMRTFIIMEFCEQQKST